MGNNLGLQIQQNQIKLAYLGTNQKDIDLIDSLQSSFLQKKLNLKNGQVLFFLKFTHQQFNQLRQSPKVKTLRQHYTNLLKTNIEIFMNTQTQINIEANMSIKQTIQQLIKGQFTPKSRHSMQSSVKFLNIIDTLSTKQVFFCFQSQLNANQLHLITKDLKLTKKYTPLPSNPYLLANLRKGSSIFLVNSFQKVQKIAGSIIGQLTIYNIISAMNKFQQFDLETIINKTFEFGDNKKADLLVQDIYGKVFTGLGMDGNIIASSLGKVGHGGQASFEDKCKSLILAFGINIAQVIQLQMKLNGINHCVLLANKFHNQYFYFVVQSIVKFFHPEGEIVFGELGNYMGCLGNIQLECE